MLKDDDLLAPLQDPAVAIGLSFVLLWTIIWKGLALYRAGANRSPGWFLALIVFNTLGILEILYFFVFSRKRKREMDERLAGMA
jgi:uncharacterized RDD family membrane protein YckC